MGITFEINSLEDMCDLMCDNKIPEERGDKVSDLISRQEAIELIHTLYPSAPIVQMNRKRWEKKYKPYIEAEKALEKLPSVQPRKGEEE